MSEQRYVVSLDGKFLCHQAMIEGKEPFFWGSREQAMEYTKRDVAEKLAEKFNTGRPHRPYVLTIQIA